MDNYEINQTNNEQKLKDLKEQYVNYLKKSEIFKWIGIGSAIIDAIYGLIFLFIYKNVNLIPNIIAFGILELIIAIGFIGFGILFSKSKAIENEGKQIDNYFGIMLEEAQLKKIELNSKIQKIIVSTLIYIFLGIMAVVILFPFYWMLNSSLKTINEYERAIPTFFPQTIKWQNYVDAYNKANLGTLFINTLYVGLVSTILSLVITVITAFAFARLEFKGKNLLFAFLLATMMIPGELFTITNYATVNQLNWMNTFAALIIPFLVSVFYIYLLRQNFLQIPNSLYLAAKVDGTSDLKYLLKVMVPLSLPTLISITILKMMGAWNSYVWPNLVANDDVHELVSNGLRGASFVDAEDPSKTNYPGQMAAVALVSLPLFLVFIFLRKYIMKGVSRSGIKG